MLQERDVIDESRSSVGANKGSSVKKSERPRLNKAVLKNYSMLVPQTSSMDCRASDIGEDQIDVAGKVEILCKKPLVKYDILDALSKKVPEKTLLKVYD